MGNTVCDIFEFVGRENVEIVEYGFLKNFAVERRNAVYAVRRCNTEISHSYNAV